MAVVLGAAGWFAYARVSSDLGSALDQDLRARGQDLSALVASGGSVSSTQGALIENGESFSEVVGSDGQVLDSTPPIAKSLLTPAELAAARNAPLFADRPSVPGLDEPARLLALPAIRGGDAAQRSHRVSDRRARRPGARGSRRLPPRRRCASAD